MANKQKYTKEYILNMGLKFVEEYGIESLNARSFAKYMNVSTQPIFRNYSNMNDLKEEIFLKAKKNYISNIIENIDENDYLLSMLYLIIKFAKNHINTYNAIFYSEFSASRSIDEIISSKWNEKIVKRIIEDYNLSIEESQNLYRDIRFYTHGIAMQVSSEKVKISDIEIKELLKNMLNKLLK